MFYFILYILIAIAIYNYYFHYLGETESEFTEETIKKMGIDGTETDDKIKEIKKQSYRIISAFTGIVWPIFIGYSFIYFIINLSAKFKKTK